MTLQIRLEMLYILFLSGKWFEFLQKVLNPVLQISQLDDLSAVVPVQTTCASVAVRTVKTSSSSVRMVKKSWDIGSIKWMEI